MTSVVALLKRSALVRAVAAWVLRWCARCSGAHVGLVVCYHKVGDPGGDPEVDLVPSLTTRLLRRQLTDLRRAYRVVPLADVRSAARRRRRGTRLPLAITFDDDLNSHAEVALPALLAAGMPATFFLSGASLTRPYSFWWEDLQRVIDRDGGLELASVQLRIGRRSDIGSAAARIELLDSDVRDAVARELRTRAAPVRGDAGLRADSVRLLADAGYEIGFHTRGHYVLPTVDNQLLKRELSEGRAELEQLTGKPVNRLAYPHGKADQRVARAARRAGFVEAFTSEPRPVGPEADPFLLGRVDASPSGRADLALSLARALSRPQRT